jgi:sporulation protein YlmC with PRC-barrel domain
MLLTTSAIIALAAGTAVAQTAQKPPQPANATGQQQMQAQSGNQQQASAPQQPTDQRQVAQQCLDDLDQLGQQMRKDGYLLTGYRATSGYWGAYGPVGPGAVGYGPGPAPAATAGQAATTAGQPMATGGQSATTAGQPTATGGQNGPQAQSRPPAGAQPAAEQAGAAQPWGDVGWAAAPGQQIRTLYAAATVLADRGDQQTCEAVTGKLRQIYGQYIDQLRQAGVKPGEIRGWRGQEILAAKPVAQLGSVRVNEVVGTDVWNGHDQQLGTVDDVVMSPKSGKVAYAVVAFGGFLGIGDTYVPVPWDKFKTTPGLNMMVLEIDQQTLEKAPHATPGQLAQGRQGSQIREKIDSYWQQVKSAG